MLCPAALKGAGTEGGKGKGPALKIRNLEFIPKSAQTLPSPLSLLVINLSGSDSWTTMKKIDKG